MWGRTCGHLSTLPDGTIVKINTTLVGWLGRHREDLVGRRRLADLLTVGGRIYYETHIAPLLSMQNSVGEVSVDMATADGGRLPVLITAAVRPGHEHGPAVVRCTVFDARDRRSYERELLHARQAAERERERVQRLATVLQRSLLPPQLPTIAGVETAAYYHPASVDEVGGAGLTLATGGHTPASVLRAAGSADFCHLAQGQLVGVVPDAHFTRAELRIEAGDTLLLYTDGLTEARVNPERDRYDEDMLQQFVGRLAPARAPDVVEALIELLAGFGDGLDDDVAILAIGIPPRHGESSTRS